MDDKRLIEVDFPIKKVSEESAREKNIRHGHICTLHIWWARRPLASSRATTFAALIPAPKNRDELRKKLDFVAELSKWENALNQRLIEKARKEIKNFFKGRPPKVLDCFAGGGSIPLEALRLGCETYALDYNPVAVLILKAVLEYPQEYRRKDRQVKGGLKSADSQDVSLVKDLKRWGNWVLKQAREEIGRFYPSDPDGNVPVGYIWARTIKCQNPSCRAKIPLMRQFWLAKTGNRKVALKTIVDKKDKKIEFKIVQGKAIKFNPSQGTTRRATAQCPICGSGIDARTLRKEGREGRIAQRLVAVILHEPRVQGKTHRIVTEKDVGTFREAEKYLEKKREGLFDEWGFDPVPDEELPLMSGTFNVPIYGITKWSDLFNSRQKLALITFVEKVRLAYKKMIEEGYEEEYAKSLTDYLALAIDRLADYNSTVCVWAVEGGFVAHTFRRQALPMVWDYHEVNPFSQTTGDWNSAMNWILRVIKHCSNVLNKSSNVALGTATRLPYPDNFFNAVITDPPYYINVPYADLSDFFYVWLKRTIGDLHPDLFATPLSPKSDEIGQMLHWDSVRYAEKNKKWFEDKLTQAFQEIYRTLKPEGIACIVFAHKSTEAWETIINSLLKSGLVLTASWPIHTERKTRLRAKESAVLASSVYMVCRKRTEEKTAYFNEIREKIENRIKEKLTQFWEQGISGADFFVSAIGPAVEVFGKYSKVERLSGEEVSVQELLEYVRKIVSEFTLERVLKRADLGGVDAETRFYLLWRWTFGNAKVHFDDAIKLSRPMGVELTNLWDRGGFVKKEKEYIRVLDPKGREKDAAFARKTKFTSMIDVLHHVAILWERGNKERIKEILDETGYAGNEIFWQTAQAISEVLPEGDKEKQLLQGFLYGKEAYIREAGKRKRTLLEFMESD